MKLIIPVVINILLAISIYLLKKEGKFKKFSYIKEQIIIGLCFGVVSAFSSSFGVEFLDIVVNIRDAAPITAGLVFGPISGVIAGFMGGTYRALSVLWGAGEYTVVACSISTIVAGITAALLRKYMFDNKRPTILYAVGITVVLEVFHMLMIFITNFNDAGTAFVFVQGCTIPMVIANSLAVGLSVFIISLIAKEFKLKRKKREKGIADTFQVWLFVSIVIAFVTTSIFTYNIQEVMYEKDLKDTFSVAITDTASDISGESDNNLVEIVLDVKEKYEKNNYVELETLLSCDDYELTEINIINKQGIIFKSSDLKNLGYNMNASLQASEFLCLINQPTTKTMVQKYQQNGYGLYRKYAGASLSNGGFIQVGYDADMFHEKLNSFVVSVTKNRHVGASGFIYICDEQFKLVSHTSAHGSRLIDTGVEINKEMRQKIDASMIYEAKITNIETKVTEDCLYVFSFIEGYCVIAICPKSEVSLMRDSSMYLSTFMQVIVFAILFVLIFYLIKKIIVNNLHKINENLAEITGGNLNVKVDVRTSEEFSTLSDDINSTVATLKRYIAEAAARIDKELEYAKQIQLSALPTNFIDNEEYTIYAEMLAAKEVGGDFYDFYTLSENKLAFLVADVSGKGIPSAMFMMTAKTIIKDLAEAGLEVEEILQRANQKLCENNESGMFVTAWMGILDTKTGIVKYANAGHNPPLIFRKGGEFEYLKSRPGFVLGGMDGIKYRRNEITLQKGDRLFLYTDGVSEATNTQQELYGEERLRLFMNENKQTKSSEILRLTKENIDLFVGEAPQFDDITMLILDYNALNKTTVSQTFKAKEQELSKVMEFFETELEKVECSMKNITAISVAVEEIFVNISHYSYGKDEGDCKITIEFNENNRELSIVIEDQGVPFNPLIKKDPDVTLSAEDREIGGLGIYIVKKTMDSVSYKYENETNILTMKKII